MLTMNIMILFICFFFFFYFGLFVINSPFIFSIINVYYFNENILLIIIQLLIDRD